MNDKQRYQSVWDPLEEDPVQRENLKLRSDILRVIDLLNGADLFAPPWVNTGLPVNDSCP